MRDDFRLHIRLVLITESRTGNGQLTLARPSLTKTLRIQSDDEKSTLAAFCSPAFHHKATPQRWAMSDVYYDRKGIRHFSTTARDAANLRYESEERQAHEELKCQTQVAQDQLKLAKENLHYSHQAAATQKRQAQVLEQQAKDAQNHLQFQKDILWLERSDALGRFDYLLNRCRTKVVAMFAEEAFNAAKINRVQVQESLSAVLRQAFHAKEQWDALPGMVEKTKAELEAARAATFKGNAGFWLIGYLVLVPALAVLLAVLVAHGAELSPMDLALCMFLVMAGTCPIGYKAVKKIRAQHQSRMAAASAQIQLTQRLAATEQKQKELQCSLVSISEQVKAEYGAWISDVRSQSKSAFQQLLRPTSIESIKSIIAQEEKFYPTALRITWDELGCTEMCASLGDLADAVSEQVTIAHGAELLAAQLTFGGEPRLAAFVSNSFHPIFGLEWDEEEGDDSVDEEEEA